MRSGGSGPWYSPPRLSNRRSVRNETYYDPEVQERAMQLADSLMRHEMSKRGRKFKLLKPENVMKFVLMVITICSYLTFIHSDYHTKVHNVIVTQIGTATPLFPSMFRVSSMSVRVNLASPLLDILLIFVIFIHQLMAAISLLIGIVDTQFTDGKEMLYFNSGLLFAGSAVCLLEMVTLIFSAQLQRRSSSWGSSTLNEGSQRGVVDAAFL